MRKPRNNGLCSSAENPWFTCQRSESNRPPALKDVEDDAINSIALQAVELLSHELAADDVVADESVDALSLYLRGVRRTELFTPQQEFETATRARAGHIGGSGAAFGTKRFHDDRRHPSGYHQRLVSRSGVVEGSIERRRRA